MRANIPERLNDLYDFCFCFSIIDMLEIPRKKIISPLCGGNPYVQSIFFFTFWNSPFSYKRFSNI